MATMQHRRVWQRLHRKSWNKQPKNTAVRTTHKKGVSKHGIPSNKK